MKKIKEICKNCKLYDPKKSECLVIILHEGKRHKLPMLPDDNCFFTEKYFDPKTKSNEDFADEIKQVKFWVEDKNGQKTNGNGSVKIEYPEGFFPNEN